MLIKVTVFNKLTLEKLVLNLNRLVHLSGMVHVVNAACLDCLVDASNFIYLYSYVFNVFGFVQGSPRVHINSLVLGMLVLIVE